jgi:hypothetical protein
VAAICGWIGKNSSRTWTVHGAFFQNYPVTALSWVPRPSSRLHKTRTSLFWRLDVCISGACSDNCPGGDDSDIRPAKCVRALATCRRVRVRVNRRSDDRRRNVIERHTIRAYESETLFRWFSADALNNVATPHCRHVQQQRQPEIANALLLSFLAGFQPTDREN